MLMFVAPSLPTDQFFLFPRHPDGRATHRPFRPRWNRRSTPSAQLPGQPANAKAVNTSTEDIFATNAGRDIFFTGRDEDMEIRLLGADLGSVDAR